MQMDAVNTGQMESTVLEGVTGEMRFDVRVPLQYRWSGRSVEQDGTGNTWSVSWWIMN